MRQGRAAAVLATMIAAGGVNADAQQSPSAVRPEDAIVRQLIARGLERSATFRDLVARLEAADVVTYVRFSPCPSRVPACLLWASSSPGVRRVVIKLDRFGGSEDTLTSLLAHELQHAWEVASSPRVRDLASFQQIFEQRGKRGSYGFETREAREIGRKVLVEISDRHVSPPLKREDPSR
jgi:hypothetical protein